MHALLFVFLGALHACVYRELLHVHTGACTHTDKEVIADPGKVL